jgi:hypothetical protein
MRTSCNENDATRWVKRGRIFKEGEEKESRNNFLLFPLLKPPLEVLETFGGAKVSDDDHL